MSYNWQFGPVWRNLDVLLSGLVVTAELTALSVVVGAGLAILVTSARLSRYRVLRLSARVYVDLFRGLPVLVLLVWLYYCLPLFAGSFLRFPPFGVAVLGLALNFAALEAEILRAGYEAIPRGEIDTGRFFGFSQLQIARHIVLPQAFWRSLPPTLGQVVNTLKLTALASFITVSDVFYVTEGLVRDTFRPLEFYTVLAGLYLLLVIPSSIVVHRLEQSLNRRFTANGA